MKYTSNQIIKFLQASPGKYTSGESINKELILSRSVINSHIKLLDKQNHSVEWEFQQGYQLPQKNDLLNSEEISAGLETEFCGSNIHCFTSTDSTNHQAHILAAQGAANGSVVLTEEQTGGKGRRGRSWFSPKGGGLWMSILLYPRGQSPEKFSPFTAAAAVMIAKALNRFSKQPITVKWPNDLLVEGKKVGGILTEMNMNSNEVNYIILGLGININQASQDFPPELQETATSLHASSGYYYNRQLLCCSILNEIEDGYLLFLRDGFAPFREAWKELSSTLGEEISIHCGKRNHKGLAVDIDEQGALVIKDNTDTRHHFSYGEIEHI